MALPLAWLWFGVRMLSTYNTLQAHSKEKGNTKALQTLQALQPRSLSPRPSPRPPPTRWGAPAAGSH